MSKLTCLKIVVRLSSVVFIVCLLITAAQGQRTSSAMPGVVNNVKWNEDSVDYSSAGKRYRFDFSTSQKSEIDAQESSKGGSKAVSPRSRRRSTDQGASTGKYLGRPLRGRQYTEVESPDGKWRAKYRDWNLVLENLKTKELVNVTTDGDEDVHFGTASWVYGEELGQKKAMWWTPDSSKIIYYKFDDTLVEKFFLLRGWSKINTSLYPEYYAKAGAKNPISELFVYDLKSKKTIRIDRLGRRILRPCDS